MAEEKDIEKEVERIAVILKKNGINLGEVKGVDDEQKIHRHLAEQGVKTRKAAVRHLLGDDFRGGTSGHLKGLSNKTILSIKQHVRNQARDPDKGRFRADEYNAQREILERESKSTNRLLGALRLFVKRVGDRIRPGKKSGKGEKFGKRERGRPWIGENGPQFIKMLSEDKEGRGGGWLLAAFAMWILDWLMQSGKLEFWLNLPLPLPGVGVISFSSIADWFAPSQAFVGADILEFGKSFTISNLNALFEIYLPVMAVIIVTYLAFKGEYNLHDFWVGVGIFAGYLLFLGGSVQIGFLTNFLLAYNVFAYFAFFFFLFWVPRRNGSNEVILFQIITFFYWAVFSFAWYEDKITLGLMLHLLFAAVFFYMFFDRVVENKVLAYFWFLSFIFVDFFLVSSVKIFATALRAGFFVIPPIWIGAIGLLSAWNSKRSWVRVFGGFSFAGSLVLYLIFVGPGLAFGSEGPETSGGVIVTGEQTSGEEGPQDEKKGAIDRLQDFLNNQVGSATPDYFASQVDANAKRKLGVFFDSMSMADAYYYENDQVTVYATIKAETIDEEVNVKVSCELDPEGTSEEFDPVKGKIDIPEGMIRGIDTLIEEDVSCVFQKGNLDSGKHTAAMTADFNFETIGYLKTHFMEDEKRRTLIKEGIDPLKFYGKTQAVSKHSPGPILIGIGMKDAPIGIGDVDLTRPSLGITIENRWPGKIKEFNDVKVFLPDGFQLDFDNCNRLFKEIDAKEIAGEEFSGFNGYKLDESELRKLKDIDSYQSFRCRLKFDDASEVLGEGPITTKFFRVVASYNYSISEGITFDVGLPPGFNVKIEPKNAVVTGKATSADMLDCIATHSDKDITTAKYLFSVCNLEGEDCHNSNEKTINCREDKRCTDTIIIDGQNRFNRDSMVMCTVAAEFEDLTKDFNQERVVIKNSPPIIKNSDVTFEKIIEGEPIECRARAREFDNDRVTATFILNSKDGEYIHRIPQVGCNRISGENDQIVCEGRMPGDDIEMVTKGREFECKMTLNDRSGRENSVKGFGTKRGIVQAKEQGNQNER